jgi:C-terminal processing protease CtpA/Prc
MRVARLLSLPLFVAALTLAAGRPSANMPPPLDFTLGVAVMQTAGGPRVTGFEKGSPTERAGARIGDVVLGADGRYTKTMSEGELRQYFEGPHLRRAELIVLRGGNTLLVIRVGL